MVVRDEILALAASDDASISLSVGAGDTLYYKSSPSVSTASYDGTLTAGQQVTLTGPKWIVSAGRSYVAVTDIPPLRDTTNVHGIADTSTLFTSGNLSVSSFARTLLDDSDVATARATLGVNAQTVYHVKDQGAVGDGTTNDTTAVQAAINAASNAGGGVVAFGPLTYSTSLLTHKAGVHYEGVRGKTELKLRNSQNTNLIESQNFSTLTGTSPSTWDGVGQVTIKNLRLNGNRANNATGGHGIAFYGYDLRLENVTVYGCKGRGIHVESPHAFQIEDQAGSSGFIFHARGLDVYRNSDDGIRLLGPTDSMLTESVIWKNGDETANAANLRVTGQSSGTNSAVGLQVSQTHIYSGNGGSFTGCTRSGDVVTLTGSPHFFTGSPVTVSGSVPTGLTAGTQYWAIKLSATTMSFATSRANALASTAIALGGATTGITVAISTASDYGLWADTSVFTTNFEAESCSVASVYLSGDTTHSSAGAVNSQIVGGHIYGNDSGGTGLSLDGTAANLVGLQIVGTRFTNNSTAITVAGTVSNSTLIGYINSSAGQTAVSGTFSGTNTVILTSVGAGTTAPLFQVGTGAGAIKVGQGLGLIVRGTHAARLATTVLEGREWHESDTGLVYVGDSTPAWQIANPHGRVVKTADETVNNSTTLQNDDHLFWPIEANEIWAFTVVLLAQGVSTNADLKVGFSGPAGVSGRWWTTANANAIDPASSPVLSTDPFGSAPAGLDNGVSMPRWIGVITNGATAGTIQFKWAQNTLTAENVKLLTGSYIELNRLA